MTLEDAIDLQRATKVYRGARGSEVRAVDDVSVQIPKGAFVALRGPSGGGKTTVLALCGALTRPSSGEVVISGQPLSKCSDAARARIRRRIGFVFQNAGLFPRLSACENVAYPLVGRGTRASDRRKQAAGLLERLGLGDRLASPPEELSGGEQQRVAFARALVAQPEILIADEPTSHLDEQTTAQLTDAIAEAHRHGTTVIMATHDPRLADRAEQCVWLSHGRIVSQPNDHSMS